MQLRMIWMAAALSALPAMAHAGGLINAQQTIFGMDCAPCAYGTEQALRKLSGVTAVTVSLNEGKASITFAPDSSTTLEQVRQAIRHNGFTPKGAVVTVEGTLRQEGNRYLLIAGAAQRYTLVITSAANPESFLARGRVRIEGRVPESDAGTLEVAVIGSAQG